MTSGSFCCGFAGKGAVLQTEGGVDANPVKGRMGLQSDQAMVEGIKSLQKGLL